MWYITIYLWQNSFPSYINHKAKCHLLNTIGKCLTFFKRAHNFSETNKEKQKSIFRFSFSLFFFFLICCFYDCGCYNRNYYHTYRIKIKSEIKSVDLSKIVIIKVGAYYNGSILRCYLFVWVPYFWTCIKLHCHDISVTSFFFKMLVF